MYHCQLGRFVSRDPAGYRGGASFVEYVWSSPTSRQDPHGLAPWHVKVDNIQFFDTCSPDIQIDYPFSVDTNAIPQNPQPTQMRIENFGEYAWIDSGCRAHLLRSMRYDVVERKDIQKGMEQWTMTWDSTGVIGVGGGSTFCLLIMANRKSLAFNSAPNGQNYELPPMSNWPWDKFTSDQIQQWNAARGPMGEFTEYHLVFVKKNCTKCIPCSVLQLLPDCVELVWWSFANELVAYPESPVASCTTYFPGEEHVNGAVRQ